MSALISIDKKQVRQSFGSAALSYDGLATLQRKVGLELLDRASLNGQVVDGLLLDIGCGTGFLTQQLMSLCRAEQVVAVDIALAMLEVTRDKLKSSDKVRYICADAEQLPLMEGSVDSIVSNLALQWCQNLKETFNGFKQVLGQNGRLYFSTFGPQTLKELKSSWAEVDDYRHVNSFYSLSELETFLQNAGFTDISIESKIYQAHYSSVFELMRELKGIGAHNVLAGRNKKITTKADMQKMITVYEKLKVNEMIPASYEIIFVSAGAGK